MTYETSDRLFRIATLIALAVFLILFATVSYLPLQDVPQQIRMLSQQRTMHPGEVTDYYEVRTSVMFGYQLYRWIDLALAPFISPAMTLRLMFIVTFVALPWSVARVSRITGGSPWLAAFLSVPIALSSQFRLGLAPFLLGFPCMLLAIGCAMEFIERPHIRKAIEMTIWLTIAYVSHPFPFGFAGLVIAVLWLVKGIRTPYATAAFLGSAVPAILMLAHDLSLDAFGNVPNTEIGWSAPKWVGQWLPQIFEDFFIQTWAISRPPAFIFHLPVYAATILCIVLGLRAHTTETSDWKRTAFVLAAIGFAVLTTIGPFSLGTAFGTSSRFALMSVVLLIVMAGRALPALRAKSRAAVVGATFIGLSFSLIELGGHARKLHAMVGDRPPRILEGRVMPVRLHDCDHETNEPWGTYDPYWHLWAYALTDRAVNAETFAFSHYHLVQFRSEVYPSIVGLPDFEGQSRFFPGNRCEDNNVLRLLWALGSHRYDSVIVMNLPPQFAQILTHTHYRVEKLTPGLTVLTDTRRPPSKRG